MVGIDEGISLTIQIKKMGLTHPLWQASVV